MDARWDKPATESPRREERHKPHARIDELEAEASGDPRAEPEATATDQAPEDKATAQDARAPSDALAAGTFVLTRDGFKSVEDVEVGDYVWSRNDSGDEEEAGFKRVDATWERVTPIVVLTLATEDGQVVRFETSREHPFYVEGEGWTDVDALAPGMLLTGEGDQLLAVVSVEQTPNVEVTYNLTVSKPGAPSTSSTKKAASESGATTVAME